LALQGNISILEKLGILSFGATNKPGQQRVLSTLGEHPLGLAPVCALLRILQTGQSTISGLIGRLVANVEQFVNVHHRDGTWPGQGEDTEKSKGQQGDGETGYREVREGSGEGLVTISLPLRVGLYLCGSLVECLSVPVARIFLPVRLCLEKLRLFMV